MHEFCFIYPEACCLKKPRRSQHQRVSREVLLYIYSATAAAEYYITHGNHALDVKMLIKFVPMSSDKHKSTRPAEISTLVRA